MSRRRWLRIILLAALAVACATGAIAVDGALAKSGFIIAALAALGAGWAEARRRPHQPTISSIVLTGLAFVGLYLGVAGISGGDDKDSSPAGTNESRLGMAVADGDIAQIRNETRRAGYADPAVAGPQEKLRYRLRVENVSGEALEGVWVQLSIESHSGRYATVRATFAATTKVARWPTDGATVNFVDSNRYIELAGGAARVIDAEERVRRLPPGIDQAGVNIGDLRAKETKYVEVPLETPAAPDTSAPPQIEGGDILRAVVGDGEEFRDPVLAGVGDRIRLRFRIHVATRQTGVEVRASIPHGRARFATVKVTASSPRASPQSTSDTLKINFKRGRRLRLRPRYGTTRIEATYGHNDPSCPDAEFKRFEDGITEGGINIGLVGYGDLDDDCSEKSVFVDFELEVLR